MVLKEEERTQEEGDVFSVVLVGSRQKQQESLTKEEEGHPGTQGGLARDQEGAWEDCPWRNPSPVRSSQRQCSRGLGKQTADLTAEDIPEASWAQLKVHLRETTLAVSQSSSVP